MRGDPGEPSGDVTRPAPRAELLVSCALCHELHAPADALAFHPVCDPCRRDVPAGGGWLGRSKDLGEGLVAGGVRRALARVRRWSRERRAAAARARFWAEVREGEREAEARARS